MIPTAEDFLFDNFEGSAINPQILIEFTKLHVKAALKAANKNAYVEYIDLNTNEIFDYTDVITDDNVEANVNKKSILNAYPLKNIK
jgi:hypothetical protein